MGDNPANPFNAEVEIGKMSVQLDNQDEKLDHIVEKLDSKEFVSTSVFDQVKINFEQQIRAVREIAQLAAAAAQAKAEAAATAADLVRTQLTQAQDSQYRMIIGAYGAIALTLIAGCAAAYFLKVIH